MSPTASYAQRLAISRLVHRFNFGPTPGQYTDLLHRGVAATQVDVLEHGVADSGLDSLSALHLPNLGRIPQGDTAASTAFWNAIYIDQTKLVSWWLDRMYLSRYPLAERMTWFWHGHWATAISKVMYPLAMQKQNNTLRKFALGNFEEMTKVMVVDGALNYWLDNEENYLTSPNENLARELMELMTLGVNKFSQHDVTAAARALTGYSTNLSTGAVGFDKKQHYAKPVTILGKTAEFNAETLASLIVSRAENAQFIADRMWFRFVSGTTKPPAPLAASFASRDISSLVSSLVRSAAWSEPANSLVKSPVEWFVGACRALKVRPSKLNAGDTQWSLTQMGQMPFNPPNVGGWPYGQAWLSGVAFQYRFELAQSLVAVGDLSPLSVPKSKMVQACADWLGVPEWSRRTGSALAAATGTPSELAIAALLSPEYVVSA
ncbi:MAG TPA: DUF1800 family protein [Acidimicrobiales bacterium]|nr:DUF1800 family protein [Acidimicrobiales bacterium]